MPVRKLKKSYRNVTGLFYSRRLRRLVQFDSLLERDFIQLLDIHPAVLSFAEQPVRIEFTDEQGTDLVYVPDFHVTFRSGVFLGRRVKHPWIVETKYQSDLKENWPKIAPKARAAVRSARRCESIFHIITEACLEGPPLENARFLRRYMNSEPSKEVLSVVLDEVRSRREGITVGDLRESLHVQHYGHLDEQALWCALAHRLVFADLERPLTSQTLVWME